MCLANNYLITKTQPFIKPWVKGTFTHDSPWILLHRFIFEFFIINLIKSLEMENKLLNLKSFQKYSPFPG